jgi:glutathione synthase
MPQIIFLIDPLDKLNTKKDSSLLLALTAQSLGHPVYLLFLEDLYYDNQSLGRLTVYPIKGEIGSDLYLKNISLGEKTSIQLRPKDQLHMRLDPPIDGRYLRTLWILQELQEQGIEVLNNPTGILNYNEKLLAYRSATSLPSYVGSSIAEAIEWVKKNNIEEGIIKPMDLFQGLGVERFQTLTEDFLKQKKTEYGGAFILQPYQTAIEEGEIRALYWRGEHLGSI